METFILPILIALGAYTLTVREQKRRIALLGAHLGKHQIEKLMGNLTEGYLRALDETDPQRRAQIWQLQASAEKALCEQFERFALEFSAVDEAHSRVSKLAFNVPYADRLFARATFDLRQALRIHAQGIANAANNILNQAPKGKAFTLSAELFLMQHTCHWFCRSKTVASARMLMRHKTSYAQLLQAVAPETRHAYGSLLAR